MRHSYVIRFALVVVLAWPALALDASLDRLLDAVEQRYNSVTTLQVAFEETFSGGGRGRKPESGELFLRKPGRMRWVYSQPAGKLFVSDGRTFYYYNPVSKQAERLKLKESEDLRAPLAFLLGKLDFQKDFQGLEAKSDAAGTIISAQPKSDKLPYRQVEFLVGAGKEIRRLVVTGTDNSTLQFLFANERLNPVLDAAQFRFELPAGATWVESGTGEAQQ